MNAPLHPDHLAAGGTVEKRKLSWGRALLTWIVLALVGWALLIWAAAEALA